jgi:hypothetical protein
VSGSYDKCLKVWDIKTGHCRMTLRGHEAAVLCVQFDKRKIVSGSCDKTIKVSVHFLTFLLDYCILLLCTGVEFLGGMSDDIERPS